LKPDLHLRNRHELFVNPMFFIRKSNGTANFVNFLTKLLFVSKLKHYLVLLLLLVAFAPGLTAQIVKEKIDTSLREEGLETLLENIPILSVDDGDNQDGSAQNISSQLSAGRDPYFNGAAFHFNAVRFRFRGYDADAFSTYMNGVPMENLDNGFTPFGLWGGLNDVLRSRDVTLGLRPTGYAFGDFGGITTFDTRASKQRKQTLIGYSIANRSYDNLVKFTHSTGLSKNGWALTLSGSGRWSEEGFTQGTYFRSVSGFIGIDKRINSRHLLSLVALGSPTENGRGSSTVDEMQQLSGDPYYNSFWGYQNGKKRNVSVAKVFQPVFILTHDWKINEKMSLITAGSYIFGSRKVSGFDWYNAADPRPDYYRYLPSFVEDPNLKALTNLAFIQDVNLRQINWDKIYNANFNSFERIANANGVPGNTITGRRSHYIIENRVVNTNRLNLNAVLNAALAPNVEFTGGASYQYQKNQYYKEVEDLLGGAFYMDVNQFAERDFRTSISAAQNDLNNPNRILRVGDKFGYNYDIDIKKAAVWAQGVFKFRKIDFFLSTEHSYTSFARIGNTKVGLFPNNSFGRSANQNFANYAFKGGITYKVDGRNYFFANGSYLTRAPFFDNAYIAPRTRDFVQNDITSERITSVEAGYVLNAPKVKIRATGFFTDYKNGLNVLTFYDEQYRNFVNYALSNIGRQHYGVEFGIDAKLYEGLSFNAAANIARYFYTTRQKATVTQDNSSDLLAQDLTIYSDNFRVPTPQEAYTAGLYYRSPNFWSISANVNYFDQMWLDFNPLRRTVAAVEGLDPKSINYNNIIEQSRLEGQYTVDIFASYSIRLNNIMKGLKKSYFLGFNLGVNNLLDNQNIVSGGFEQLRFDFQDKNVNKFPARKFMSFGRTFFAGLSLRF